MSVRRRPKWGRGYAMVPGWLLLKEPSPNALTVYVHLAMHGTFHPGEGTYEQCRPSKKTLAKGDPERGYPGCGLSEQVIGRALRELETLRAIKGEPFFDPKKNGAQGATVYRLIFGEVTEEDEEGPGDETAAQQGVSTAIPPSGETTPRITGDTGPGYRSDTPPPVSPVIHNPEPFTQNPEPRKDQTPPPPALTSTHPAREPAPQPGPDRRAPRARTPEPAPKPEEGGEPVPDEVIDALRADRPTWTRAAIRRALTDPDVVEREQALPGVALAALGLLAADTDGSRYGVSHAPGRLSSSGEWWSQAEAALRRPAAVRNAERPPCPSGCRHSGRIWVNDTNDHPRPLHCPVCRPDDHAEQLERKRIECRQLGIEAPRDFDELAARIRTQPALAYR